MNLIDEIIEKVKKEFESARGSHDWEHTERVYNLCIRIGKKVNADMNILVPAAILHDIGRTYEDSSGGGLCHAEKGAFLAGQLLRGYGMEEGKIKKILHCIETHRFRGNKIPESLEAKILFDADKLDSIGATGIGRAFLFAGEIGAKLHNKKADIDKTAAYTVEDTAWREYMVKLRYIKDKMMTEEGRIMAEERHIYMSEFFERLNREVDGEI